MRGIYGRFDSKSNRTANSIRTQKNDSQVPKFFLDHPAHQKLQVYVMHKVSQ